MPPRPVAGGAGTTAVVEAVGMVFLELSFPERCAGVAISWSAGKPSAAYSSLGGIKASAPRTPLLYEEAAAAAHRVASIYPQSAAILASAAIAQSLLQHLFTAE